MAVEIYCFCSGRGILRTTTKYRDAQGRPRKFYGCEFWPDCDGSIGCHPGTETPLGTMAGGELKQARKDLHSIFDAHWSNGRERRACYARLAEAMEIDVDDCHVGMFDLDDCERAAEIVAGWD